MTEFEAFLLELPSLTEVKLGDRPYLWHLTTEQVKKLIAALGNAPRLRHLNLDNIPVNYSGTNGATAADLVNAVVKCKNLQSLSLAACRIGDAEVETLAVAIARWPSLQRLNLGGNNYIQSAGAKALAAAIEKSLTLQSLSLRANQRICMDGNYLNKEDTEGFRALLGAIAKCPTMRELSLEFMPLYARHAVIVAEVLATSNVEILDLSSNRMGENDISNNFQGARAIAKLLEESAKLRCLNLNTNQFGSESMQLIIAAVAKSKTLQKLELSFNTVKEQEVKALAAAIDTSPSLQSLKIVVDANADLIANAVARSKTMKSLSIKINNGTDSFAARKSFIDIVKSSSLEELDFSWNTIDAQSIEALAVMIEHGNLRTLCLDLMITAVAEGVQLTIGPIANALAKPSSKLLCLHLDNNHIDDAGAIALATALATSRLITLSIKNNRITYEGAKALAAAIANNAALQSLDISTNAIGSAGYAAFAAALYTAKNLQSLDICSSRIQVDTEDARKLIVACKIQHNQSLHFLECGSESLSNEMFFVTRRLFALRARIFDSVAPAMVALLASVVGENPDTQVPVIKFICADGDHALLGRVLQLLAGFDGLPDWLNAPSPSTANVARLGVGS